MPSREDLPPPHVLPLDEPAFGAAGGRIGPTFRESVPEWPRRRVPPAGAPNVVVILMDGLPS